MCSGGAPSNREPGTKFPKLCCLKLLPPYPACAVLIKNSVPMTLSGSIKKQLQTLTCFQAPCHSYLRQAPHESSEINHIAYQGISEPVSSGERNLLWTSSALTLAKTRPGGHPAGSQTSAPHCWRRVWASPQSSMLLQVVCCWEIWCWHSEKKTGHSFDQLLTGHTPSRVLWGMTV